MNDVMPVTSTCAQQVGPDTTTKIHRCRLYRLSSVPQPAIYGYTEVWDLKSEPYEKRGPLPEGELVVEEQDPSPQVVSARMEQHRKRLNILLVGACWGYRGM